MSEHLLADLKDPLTGLGNRAALFAYITTQLAQNTPFTVLLLDLDEFRVLNDSLGHAYGDRVLKAAGRRLNAVFDDHLFRAGGDEFAVVLPSSDASVIDGIVETVLVKWRTPLVIDAAEIYSGISIGIVSRTSAHHDAGDILRDSELAMYEAKRLGRGRAVTFQSELREAADRELETQMLGRRAVANREFHILWQPIFNLQTGAVVSCEALLRWRPAGGLSVLPAADFIPFLERSGLIIPVGEFVIEQAFQQHAQWRSRSEVDNDFAISINVSENQLQSGGVVDSLLAALERSGVPGRELIVEVPESIMGKDITGKNNQPVVDGLSRLRTHGVRIAIDDFGGGQGSLLALSDFPVDIVKLNRSAVSRITSEKELPALSAIQALVKSHGLTIVATGIENDLQLSWLHRREWQWAQGFFIGKPADKDEITTLLSSQKNQQLRNAA